MVATYFYEKFARSVAVSSDTSCDKMKGVHFAYTVHSLKNGRVSHAMGGRYSCVSRFDG